VSTQDSTGKNLETSYPLNPKREFRGDERPGGARTGDRRLLTIKKARQSSIDRSPFGGVYIEGNALGKKGTTSSTWDLGPKTNSRGKAVEVQGRGEKRVGWACPRTDPAN